MSIEIYKYATTNAEQILRPPKTIGEMQKSIEMYNELIRNAPIKQLTFPHLKDYFVILGWYICIYLSFFLI